MAKERFLIIASPTQDDCFTRFSETANRAAISAGTMDPNDPYSWIEKSFEIRLVEWRKATHICSFTPSARFEWVRNRFVGLSHSVWEENPDPECLEIENGGGHTDYAGYQDDYDPRFIVADFVVDSMRDLGLRKPRDLNSDTGLTYTETVWLAASEHAQQCYQEAPVLNVWEYRKWERACRDAVRARACAHSKALALAGGLFI